MKNFKKTYILLLLFTLSVIYTYGQKNTLDSVCVQMGENLQLNMAIYDYSDLIENVSKDLKSLQVILKDNNNIPEKGFYTISYEPDKLVSIKQSEQLERIIWEDGKQTNYQFNNQCKVKSNNYYLEIRFNELEDIVSDSLIVKIKEVIDSTNILQGRLSTTFNYSWQGAELLHNKELDKQSSPMDMISLSGGVGVNLIKNEPVIDISAQIGFIFSKKGILKNEFYVSYNLLSDFADSSKIHLNSFINVGYRYNLSKVANKSNWLGVEFGYLLSQNGELFKENTFKLGVNWSVGKYISVSPQLYLSGDLKEVYPAIRIGFGF